MSWHTIRNDGSFRNVKSNEQGCNTISLVDAQFQCLLCPGQPTELSQTAALISAEYCDPGPKANCSRLTKSRFRCRHVTTLETYPIDTRFRLPVLYTGSRGKPLATWSKICPTSDKGVRCPGYQVSPQCGLFLFPCRPAKLCFSQATCPGEALAHLWCSRSNPLRVMERC